MTAVCAASRTSCLVSDGAPQSLAPQTGEVQTGAVVVPMALLPLPLFHTGRRSLLSRRTTQGGEANGLVAH